MLGGSDRDRRAYWFTKRLQNIILWVILKCAHCMPLSDVIISLPIEPDMHEIHNWNWLSKERNYFLQRSKECLLRLFFKENQQESIESSLSNFISDTYSKISIGQANFFSFPLLSTSTFPTFTQISSSFYFYIYLNVCA